MTGYGLAAPPHRGTPGWRRGRVALQCRHAGHRRPGGAGRSGILGDVPAALAFTIRIAAYLFLAGVLMVVLSPVPALARRFPRLYLAGFMLAVLSLFMVLAGALTWR